MNSLKRSKEIKYAALAVLAIALVSGLANAQEVAGKFNLTFTARWGMLVLTPGQYSFSNVPTQGGIPVILVQRGTRKLGMVMTYPLETSDNRLPDPSHLTAVLTSGGYRISSLQLSRQGITLGFFAPKAKVLEAANQPARTVPILLASR